MVEAHRNMNIGALEFFTVVQHVLGAMNEHGYEKRERDEVLAILYSLKPDVVHQ